MLDSRNLPTVLCCAAQVGDAMVSAKDKKLVTVKPNTPMSDAAQLMLHHDVSAGPGHTSSGRCLLLVSFLFVDQSTVCCHVSLWQPRR